MAYESICGKKPLEILLVNLNTYLTFFKSCGIKCIHCVETECRLLERKPAQNPLDLTTDRRHRILVNDGTE